MAAVNFSPRQVGHAIGTAIAGVTVRLTGHAEQQWLADAQVSGERYRSEFLLLSAAAALHAVESSALPPAIEAQLVAGFRSWIVELEAEPRALLLAELDEVKDYYAEAAATERGAASLEDVSELECAFGDRLLALGNNNEARGRACLKLSLVIPSVLWSSQVGTARQMLAESKLLSVQ
jgi:hypothetical protein